MHCSFCEKSQHEVRKLVAGPKAYICDECIEQCNEIVQEEDFKIAMGSHATLVAYVVHQEEAIENLQRRIRDAVKTLGPALGPGNDMQH